MTSADDARDNRGTAASDSPDNVDAAELERFGVLAQRWWDPDGEMRPLHDMNPLRTAYIDRRAPLAGRRVLDVGCGGGLLSEAMAERSASVTGIDLGSAALAVAREHCEESGLAIDYREIGAEALAEREPAGFDTVTCLELLEHVPEPGALVHACARLVRPGGSVFFSTINRNPQAYLLAIVAAEYVLGLLPRGTHRYARLIRPAELDRWCREAGLETREISGVTYDPFTRRARLTPSPAVNYFLHAVRPAEEL